MATGSALLKRNLVSKKKKKEEKKKPTYLFKLLYNSFTRILKHSNIEVIFTWKAFNFKNKYFHIPWKNKQE